MADGTIATGSQTGYLMALVWDLIPDEQRENAFAHLCRDIEDRGHRLSTGFVGVPLLGPVLTSLGSIGEWLWRSAAGIDQAPGSVAYADLVIAPQFGPRLDWVTAHYDSPRGLVRVEWRRSAEGVDVEVEIPPGSPAQLRLPGQAPGRCRPEPGAALRRPGIDTRTTGSPSPTVKGGIQC